MADNECCSNQVCNVQAISESVEHFLLRCPAYLSSRNILKSNLVNIGVMKFILKTLLIGDKHPREKDIVRYVMEFVKSTGRLERL